MHKESASLDRTQTITQSARLFLFACLALFLGCATPEGPVLNTSLEDLDRAIRKQIPGGVNHISENGRTYISNFYDPFNYDHQTNGVKDKRDFRRYRAFVVILGDHRPYELDVRVDVEVRAKHSRVPASKRVDVTAGEFEPYDTSPAAEERIVHDIRTYLREYRQNSNVIDNFKPF